MSKETTSVAEDVKAKFSIGELITEHEKFEHISDMKFISSNDLCSMVSSLFSNIFSDYEGCKFDFVPGTNIPVIQAYFNHRNQVKTVDGENLPFGITKEDTDNKTINNTLRSTRSYNARLINGDRYFLTDEGKSLSEFVVDLPQFKNRDGEVIWNKLVSDVADGNYGSTVPQQLTLVNCLDAAKIVEAIFGKTDSDGISWVYGVRVMRSIPTCNIIGGMASSGFMLAIERVSENEVEALARQFGLNVNYGLNIIR